MSKGSILSKVRLGLPFIKEGNQGSSISRILYFFI